MDNRKASRYEKRLKVTFGPVDATDFGFLKDISSTGIRISTDNVYMPGTTLKMNFHDDTSDTVMLAEGNVAWVKGTPVHMIDDLSCDMGIQFRKVCPILRRFTKSLVHA